MQYFFILGRIPDLSIAELSKFANLQEEAPLKIRKKSSKFIVIETDKEIDISFWQKQLGGVIKSGKIIGKADKIQEEEIKDILLGYQKEKRIFFGLSFYSPDNRFSFREAKNYSLGLKKILKKEKISISFIIEKDRPFLSSGNILRQRLLEKGVELVFLIEEKEILIGATQALQSIKEEAEFDFLRPYRNISQGLIPPKLAKIMINLASVKKEEIILDPFCGSGTILGEAFLMGHKNLVGSDIDEKLVEETRKNLEWLQESFSGKISNQVKIKIFRSDIKDIWREIPPGSIDAIITEPYLGPMQVKKIKIQNIVNDLSSLYLQSFKSFKKILKPDGRIVIIFPVFRIEKRQYFLPIIEQIQSLGFKKENLSSSGRGSLLYSRPDQTVLREFFIFHL